MLTRHGLVLFAMVAVIYGADVTPRAWAETDWALFSADAVERRISRAQKNYKLPNFLAPHEACWASDVP